MVPEVMEQNYPERDFHIVYAGEVIKVLVHANAHLFYRYAASGGVKVA